ncbi:NAD(P)/FAD-dependent oxidoreductase [Rhodococcus koreensis]|uniref:NAD(P)/FAD-dependent oxidoreductase n=1 Tax=Rhodococcus koreensis TaxID=99653 RepID=UPI0036714888
MVIDSSARFTAEVAVIGAGAIGAAIANALAEQGREVIVIERGPHWAAGCSWGNAGLICPSHAGPWASSSDITTAIRWMLKRNSPLGMRPTPALVRFMAQLLLAGKDSVEEATILSRNMCRESLDMHEKMAADGLDTGFTRTGLLDVYATAAGLERGTKAAERHRQNGVECTVMTAAETRALEPALESSVAGAVFFPSEAHCDPARFVAAVGNQAEQRGARLLANAVVLGLAPRQGGVDITTGQGTMTVRTVVVAGGAWTSSITKSISRRLPLQGGKGYTLDLTAGDRPALGRPVMLQEERVALTPLEGRLRMAGTMQFNGLSESIDIQRVDAIHTAATRALPSWKEATVERVWSGLRPCTPDGLPLVGWIREGAVAVATGHAMLGLTLAPLTARHITDLLAGNDSAELTAQAPARVGRLPARMAG